MAQASVRPSVVRKFKSLGNCCMELVQILCLAPSPPYLQGFFFSFFKIFNFQIFIYFLALLDYVSRAHEIEIRPSSVRLSVRRPSSICGINYLWSYCMDFFQILVVASPGPYAQTFFSFWKKKNFWIFYEYFSFSLTWDPMGVKISKCYSSYKLQPKVFKLFLNFFS